MSKANEIHYTLSELKSKYNAAKKRLSAIMVEKASIIKNLKNLNDGITSIENEVQTIYQQLSGAEAVKNGTKITQK